MIDQTTLERLYAPPKAAQPKAKVFTEEGWALVQRVPEVGYWTRSYTGSRAYVDAPEILAYMIYR